MMAANYRHIGGGVNRLGRHYTRFSGFWPTASVVDQSLALRKSRNAGSNRPRRVSAYQALEDDKNGLKSLLDLSGRLAHTAIAILTIPEIHDRFLIPGESAF